MVEGSREGKDPPRLQCHPRLVRHGTQQVDRLMEVGDVTGVLITLPQRATQVGRRGLSDLVRGDRAAAVQCVMARSRSARWPRCRQRAK